MNSRTKAPRRIVFDRNTDGHRASYLEIFRKTLGAEPLTGSPQDPRLLKAPDLICLSVDDYFLSFVGIAVRRALRGLPTTGLLLRAENLVQKSWTPKRLLKAALLLGLKILRPKVRTVGIVPFEWLPGLRRYLTDSIYDLQFWDLMVLGAAERPSTLMENFLSDLRRKAQGRRVVMALGRQDASKGILFFNDLWLKTDISRDHLFVVVGPNRTGRKDFFDAFLAKGGMVLDHYVSENDLLNAYQQADFVWAVYHPTYDVSSGIFGRALQLGRYPLLRKGSLMDRMAKKFTWGSSLEWGRLDPEPLRSLRVSRDQTPPTGFRNSFDDVFGTRPRA